MCATKKEFIEIDLTKDDEDVAPEKKIQTEELPPENCGLVGKMMEKMMEESTKKLYASFQASFEASFREVAETTLALCFSNMKEINTGRKKNESAGESSSAGETADIFPSVPKVQAKSNEDTHTEDDVFIPLTEEKLRNLAKNVPLSVFVVKLLKESFQPGYFETHNLKHISKSHLSRLYEITNFFKSSSAPLSRREFKSVLTKEIKQIQINCISSRRHQAHQDILIHRVSKKELQKLTRCKNGSFISCVRFIGLLLMKVFPKDYFLEKSFDDITSLQMNKIYEMVESQYTEIKRKRQPIKPLSLDEVKLVIKQKITTIRSQHVKSV